MKKYYLMLIFLLLFTFVNSFGKTVVSDKSKKGYPLTKTVTQDKVENSCGSDMERWCVYVVVESQDLSGDIILANQSLNCWVGVQEIPSLSVGYINVILQQDYDMNSNTPLILYFKPQTQTFLDYNIWLNQIDNLNSN